MTFTYEYERPGVTTDIAVIHNDDLLLIKRGGEPYKNFYALPGGFLNSDEDIYQCAVRELKEETGLSIVSINFHFVGVYSSPGRDPRGWTISNLFLYDCRLPNRPEVTAMDDAIDFKWIKRNERVELAFDHLVLMNDAFIELDNIRSL
jgi:8-oxo-dGTP diphosphatase